MNCNKGGTQVVEMSIADRWQAMNEMERGAVSSLHSVMYHIIDNPEQYSNPVQLIEDCEYTLQGLWKFTRDANFHTWWLRTKGCTCPRMDNTDPMFFGAGKITVSDCPWHWKGGK